MTVEEITDFDENFKIDMTKVKPPSIDIDIDDLEERQQDGKMEGSDYFWLRDRGCLNADKIPEHHL